LFIHKAKKPTTPKEATMKKINGINVLETADIERHCPSFYATAPKADVSEKYAFLNTRDIAVQLWGEGWMPVYAREARSVDRSNRGLTRHVVRWAHRDLAVNGERIELVGVNSHNRATAFTFMAGIFRLVCSNGMIAKTADFGSFKVRHVGDIHVQVQAAVKGIANAAHGIARRMDEFKAIELTPDEQGVFAATAHRFIYGEDPAPIRPEQLLRPRRYTDAAGETYNRYNRAALPKPDLWTTFNVVQENVIKGGLRGRGSTGRRMKTRAVKSIDRDVKLNQALWAMTETMAELKAAA
jgi:hypothetical protein